MGFLLILIILHAEHLCMVLMLYTKCPPPSLLGRSYSAVKIFVLSILLVAPPLTAYTHDPGGYDGNIIFLQVTICLGDITGCTPPFLLIELIIFTVTANSYLINRVGIRFISFKSFDLTHLALSFTNLIPSSMKCTWEFALQQYKLISCSLNSVLHDSNALFA